MFREGDDWFTRVLHGNRPIELQSGKGSIKAGELDKLLEATAKKQADK